MTERAMVVNVPLELTLGRARIAVESELPEDRRGDEWSGAGEKSAASEFRHG